MLHAALVQRVLLMLTPDSPRPKDLDMGDVLADAMQDPSLDRACDDPINCPDTKCPLVHADHYAGLPPEAHGEDC